MSFKTLQFITPDVILCLNGTLPETTFFHTLSQIPIVSADGAAIQLRKVGLLPQYIVGDLDSLIDDIAFWKQHEDIIIQEVRDQNSTDFEKSLEYIQQLGYSSPVICGFHGGELDHTLNNWSILMRYGKIMSLTVYDSNKIAFPIYESIIVKASEGEMISLIPQPRVYLTTDGLEWNLHNEELCLGKREGARNRATKEQVKIKIHSGAMLLFQDARLPYIPQISTL